MRLFFNRLTGELHNKPGEHLLSIHLVELRVCDKCGEPPQEGDILHYYQIGQLTLEIHRTCINHLNERIRIALA